MASWLQQQASQAGPGRYAMRASQDMAGMEGEDAHNRTPPSVRRSGAALRASVLEIPSDMSPGRSERAFRTGNERLYEAYNDLHALAQDFEKPFDAPAILVVGHQTDGKSALVEALMGFQFNHVGGGTKTRRPITLHMKYNSACVQPNCYLLTEEFGEQEATLEELQDYIENENARLDREAQFWSKEIVVRIEYKFCPNLTIIDTPGLISAAPGKRNSTLQNSARQVEAMVRLKMEQKEYIILCLEDSNDWSNATTRRLVMQVDPSLSRTVVVSTKLDTRIPQFARPHDVEMYLRPPSRMLEPTMLGGSPFFTSVPSGRVGNSKDAIFRSNEHFREAVADREAQDVSELESRLGRKLDKAERARIGVGQLRRFLEHLLQRRYLENVPTIVPVLEKEYRNASRRLEETQVELHDLHPEKLKEKGRIFREAFISKLSLLLRGTVAAPPERFGETLADEHIRGGAFVGPDNKPVVVHEHLPNAHMRLFGGAQYHRAMAEFRAGIGTISCPDISREEIVNACGIDDFHDGVNYTRTACVIAVSKAKDLFEPFLHQLGYRLAHVQRRMLPIAMHLLQKDGQFLNGHDLFLKRVGAAYHAFIDEFEKGSRTKCMEDLQSTTRYVTWSLHTKSRSSLKSMLSKVTAPSGASANGNAHGKGGGSGVGEGSAATADFLENTLWNRTLGAMSEEIVAALVCQIFEGIRDHFVQSVELKFNCFFLMPIIDTFPTRLREELESAYEEDLDEVFDVAAVRAALEQRLKSLELELHQVERLQRKFAMIHSTLAQQASAKAEPDTPKLRASEENPLNMSMRSSLPGGVKASQDLGKKVSGLDLNKGNAGGRAVLASMRGGAVLVTSTAEAAAAVAHGTPADVLLARRLSVPVGAAAGIVGSVAGSGGAAVIVPLISARATSIAQRVLAGTSAAAVFATAATATVSFAAAGCIDWPAALLIAPPAVAMAPLGARFTSRLNCAALKRLLGFFLLGAAPLIPLKFYLFSGRDTAPGGATEGAAGSGTGVAAVEAADGAADGAKTPAAAATAAATDQERSWVARLAVALPAPPVAATMAVTGGVAGFAGGLMGIGPAMIIVPVVALVTPWTQAKVLGTVLAAMVPTSAGALAMHHRLGNVDWRMAAGLAAGTLVGGAVGGQAAVHAPPGTLEGVFFVVTLVLARMTLRR